MSFTLLTSALSGVIMLASLTHHRIAYRQHSFEQALYVAESGMERAAEYVRQQNGYLGNLEIQTGTVGDGTFEATITKVGWRAYSVSSVGTVDGVSRTVAVARLYLPSYATYALWSDQNNPIYFIPKEVFFGKVHANDRLYFSSSAQAGGPEFWEDLTSGWHDYGGNADYVTFHKDFELNSPVGSMADVDFGELKGLAQTWGIELEGQTQIAFDGPDMLITNTRKGWTDHRVPIGEDKLVYVKDSTSGSNSTKAGTIYVEGGTIDGRLTLVSDNDTWIRNHIQYAQDPRTDPDSDDALGIVSKDDVWVDTSAPDNLVIQGAIMATGRLSSSNRGSFGVYNYNTGDPRGALQVTGSIVQDLRGAVGTFNASGSTHGYFKNYMFDKRFESSAPPYYPVISEIVKFEGWSDKS